MAISRQERIDNLHYNIDQIYQRLEDNKPVDSRDLDNLSQMITNLNRLEAEQELHDLFESRLIG